MPNVEYGATDPLSPPGFHRLGPYVQREYGPTQPIVSSGGGAAASAGIAPSASSMTYYQMGAIDPDCNPPAPVVPWTVKGSPDLTGAQYNGPRCGSSPLVQIQIMMSWTGV